LDHDLSDDIERLKRLIHDLKIQSHAFDVILNLKDTIYNIIHGIKDKNIYVIYRNESSQYPPVQFMEAYTRVYDVFSDIQQELAHPRPDRPYYLPGEDEMFGLYSKYLHVIQLNQSELELLDGIYAPIVKFLDKHYAKKGYSFFYFTMLDRNLYEETLHQDSLVTPQNFEYRTKTDINRYQEDVKYLESIKHLKKKLPKIPTRYGTTRYPDHPREGSYKMHYNKYAPFVDEDNVNCKPCVSRFNCTYTKGDVINAISELGFAIFSDQKDDKRQIVVADIKEPDHIVHNDDIVPIVGFEQNQFIQNDHVDGRRAGQPMKTHDKNGRWSLHSAYIKWYYEILYRTLARTSQHLPWKAFISALSANSEAVLPVKRETMIFIGHYDYHIPMVLLEKSSTLEICQIIDSRISAIQNGFLKEQEAIEELKEIQPQLTNYYNLPRSIFPIKLDKYFQYHADLRRLCETITQRHKDNPYALNDLDERAELYRMIDEMDVHALFTKPASEQLTGSRPLSSYSNFEICHILLKHIDNEFRKREEAAEYDTRHL
jgi:hypothetical protein